MSDSKTKSRAKKKTEHKTSDGPHAQKSTRWTRAFHDYGPLLIAGLCYVAAVAAEAIYCGVPPKQFARVGYAILIVAIKCVLLLVALGVMTFWRELPKHRGANAWKRTWAATQKIADNFLGGEVFAHGCAGVLALVTICFFFIQKSLIRFVNPYHWDPAIASLERFLHFGHYPHEWVIPMSDFLGVSHLYDVAYYLWFVMMYIIVGYSLFVDTNLKRRLRVMWVFFLSWTLLGSLAATLLSSVGPLFFHDFYPDRPDPYSGLLEHFLDKGAGAFPIAYFSRTMLISWTHSPDLINANALSAMPSLHIAICWVAVLYTRVMSRAWFVAALAFTAMIFFGTIYFGFHYASDGYLSIATVSILWWGIGKLLDRKYGDTVHLKRF